MCTCGGVLFGDGNAHAQDCADYVPDTKYYLLLDEAQARALMHGTVPDDVRESARCMVDWQWELAKNAARPINTDRDGRPIRKRGRT